MDFKSIDPEWLIRIGFFVAGFTVLVVWEGLAPRRQRVDSRVRRWIRNIGVAVMDTVIVRWLFPIAAVGIAVEAANRGWGLFNNVSLPGWLVAIICLLTFDFLIYMQHMVFHRFRLLWRLHAMHHSDLDLDLTSSVRFHPVEIALSMLIKMAAVVAMGAPPQVVLAFELILFGLALFNHSNIRIPAVVDRILRLFIVTPDMHRVHHSVVPRECHSNFGFNLTWWDRLFGTYRAQPAAGHTGMTIGLGWLQDPGQVTFPRMLAAPFMPRQGK